MMLYFIPDEILFHRDKLIARPFEDKMVQNGKKFMAVHLTDAKSDNGKYFLNPEKLV